MRSDSLSFNKQFSHIYIEEDAAGFPLTERICSFFPHAEKIFVQSYKEIFSRPRQSYSAQVNSRSLILAVKKDGLIYEGSVMCHDFDQRWFYYCTNVLNCIYDCEYCWLKGMYGTANLVIFVNTDDFLKETERLLKEHPVYLCLSYENDLVPLENMTGLLKEWAEFTVSHPNLLTEIRTKCADREIWKRRPVSDRIIPAFTLSPDTVISAYEHGTPDLKKRIEAVNTAAEQGFHPRLCFDPVFAVKDWQKLYTEMIKDVMTNTGPEIIRDVSIGTFRLSRDYMKKMRRAFPFSACVQYPYTLKNGYYGYDDELRKTITEFMENELMKYISKDKIYTLEDDANE